MRPSWRFLAALVHVGRALPATLSRGSERVMAARRVRRLDANTPAREAAVAPLSLSMTMSRTTFLSDGQSQTTVVTVGAGTQAPASTPPSTPSTHPQTLQNTSPPFDPKHAVPVVPIVAAACALALLGSLALLYFFCCFRRQRLAVCQNDTKAQAQLDLEIPTSAAADAPGPGGRSFSHMTFSAPYVVPQSSTSPSTAAPSTVSVGQQYRTAPVVGRRYR